MAEEKSGLEIDDWLDDLAEDKPAPAEEAPGELDQSDIDSLLGGGAAASSGPPADEGGELDQSDIDALLGGGGGATSVSATGGGGEGFAELDQSDIDSLLGGGAAPAVAAAPAAGDDFDLDQSDIDGLFASAGAEKAPSEPSLTEGLGPPSKDDLDSLFSDLGDEEPGQPETVNFSEVAQGGGGKAEAAAFGEDSFGLPDDGGFDDDEFDFGDLPDIPDEGTSAAGTAAQGGMGEEDIFATASPVAEVPDFLAEATMDNSREKPSASGTDHPFAPPPKAGKKKGMAVAVCCLLLLAGGGGYFFMKNKKGVMPVPVPPPAQEKPVAAPEGPPVVAAPVGPPNAAPVASESRWRMTKANEALSIELSGTDENNDPLKFEILTPPKFGRISGDLPKITYLPNKDFPGEDSFEFRVSDGQLTSAPAKAVVMGPEEAKPVVAEAPKEGPPPEERPAVAAQNVRLKTLSTAPLTINWKKIWAGANPEQPFDAKVSVEILGGAPLRGGLHRLDRGRHLYEPDRYFGGKEEVRYRFKAAGVYSKAAKLIITVKPNDKPPVLALRPVADSYKVGESVVLDAGLTRDDSPGGVQYSWEQMAGVPVHLEKFHGEASAVSFVVPSSFRGEQKNRIVIRVTATDPGGQRASKEIGITPVSKRQTALWGIPE